MKRIYIEQTISNDGHVSRVSVEAWIPTEEKELDHRFPALIILEKTYNDRLDEDGDKFVERFEFPTEYTTDCSIIRNAIKRIDHEVGAK
jgi:hypothetical protein